MFDASTLIEHLSIVNIYLSLYLTRSSLVFGNLSKRLRQFRTGDAGTL
jgi:hypothetical protein